MAQTTISGKGVKVVTMISDTMSQPTKEMRDVMYSAQVGDDERGMDDNFKRLEDKVAKLTGKEASIYMPSGMMSNLISVMVHCPLRNQEILLGDESDLEHCEQASFAQVAGRSHRTVKTNENGTLDMDDLEDKIRPPSNNHFPVSRLICIENTNNRCGGVVLPLEFLRKLKDFATDKGLLVHLDGARVWNAVVHLGIQLADIAKYADSISFCIYKGLAAPAGSMLSGTKEFIEQARYIRKMLGGAQRKSGFFATAGIFAIDTVHERLQEDHKHAKSLAEGW
ncbi:putative low-specificity L-threonine aldolase 2 [Nymphon striatum]|nr:putative low-specificity L-threonine aldolase 2 [Nymphon striatum]